MGKKPAEASRNPLSVNTGTTMEEIGTMTPQALNAKLTTDAEAILISKGIDPVIASQAADAIVNWAFCIFIGRAPYQYK